MLACSNKFLTMSTITSQTLMMPRFLERSPALF